MHLPQTSSLSPGRPRMNGSRLVSLVKIALWLFWSTVIGALLLASIADHPLALKPRSHMYIGSVAPEAWRFFTRDPKEPVEHAYGLVDGRWVDRIPANATAANWFGMRKDSRLLSIELSYLMAQVPANAWNACEAALLTCVAQDRPARLIVENRSSMQGICGPTLIEKRPIVPWAWSRSHDDVQMPAEYVRLDVRCTPRAS